MEKKMKTIVKDEPLMSYSVSHSKKDGYNIAVKVHGKTVNVWNLGDNEEIAQSKTATILDSYSKGLEYVQEQVRAVFASHQPSEP